MAAGWPPPTWSFDGPSENTGWVYARNRLREMKPGDKVVPFLLNWRIGPVGTIIEVRAGDEQWNHTVEKGSYAYNFEEPELGRRVLVKWELDNMPPDGMCALVPKGQRPAGPLSKHTIESLTGDAFQFFCSILSDRSNWIDVISPTAFSPSDPFSSSEIAAENEVETLPLQPPPAELALLERDLQKFLSRNLEIIEKGLAPDPSYQLEEYTSDVGRMDFLCKDAQGNWVVIELKAGWAGDDAIGQTLGYMSWVKENLPGGETVRGIIICKDATGRVKAAARLAARLSIKRFSLNCSIYEMQ